MKRILNALLLTILSLQVASAQSSEPTQAPDSVKVSELDEIVVEGKNATAKAGSISVIPQKQQIEASATGYDLLFNMSIPVIRVDPRTETVTNNFGNSVALFINGMPATKDDIRALRTKDVFRVEYLEAPQDSRFGGNPYVINYILKERNWGGYTKLLGNAIFFNGNTDEINVYSNFVYKRMTYDLYAAWGYYNIHHTGADYVEHFSLLTPEGKNENVEREQKTNISKYFQHNIPVTFRATYNSEKVQVINRLYFSFFNTPRSFLDADLILHEKGTSLKGFSFSDNSSLNRSAGWDGWINIALPKNYSITLNGKLNYLKSNNQSLYESEFLNSSSIINNNKEQAWDTRWDLTARKRLNDRIYLGLEYSFMFRDGKIDYWGTSPEESKQIHTLNRGGVSFQAFWQKMQLTISAGVANERMTIGGNSLSYTYPNTHIFLNYSPAGSHQLSLQFSYAATSPGLAEKSENIIQRNEFLYVTGNPDLKCFPHIYSQIGYNWFPRNNLAFSFFGSLFHNHNLKVRDYDHYDEGKALLETYINNGNSNNAAIGVNAQYSPLRSLQLALGVGYQYINFDSKTKISQHSLPVGLAVTYYLKNFNFTAVYNAPLKSLDIFNLTKISEKDRYRVSIGWNKNDLNISLTAYNFFRTNWRGSHSIYTSPLYTNDSWDIDHNVHASLQLKIAYTFGYGKKVERGNEIGAQEGIESGVLK